MKKLLFLFLISTCWSCTQTEYLVRSDQAPETDFAEYDTYNFATQALSTDATFVLHDLALKNTIREAIAHEMLAKDYERATTDADLLVNFRVFEGPTEYRGYEQSTSGYWAANELIEFDDIKTYQLEAGTLMVDLVDKNTGELVWTGYASGILDKDKFDRDAQSVAEAVSRIFERYQYRAD